MLTLQVTKNKMQAAVGCRLLCPLRVKLLGLAHAFRFWHRDIGSDRTPQKDFPTEWFAVTFCRSLGKGG